ncbi:hypothetical protein BGW37DRAFT_469769 [Umbelopsis sp. PMI_123]|nr:hypothetical protein BGW37DRAFT_469769 [Umbelopsis sp. PMI_123]
MGHNNIASIEVENMILCEAEYSTLTVFNMQNVKTLMDEGRQRSTEHGILGYPFGLPSVFQNPTISPFYNGRFTNGPIWLEEVAKLIPNTTIINRGLGASTTDDSYDYSDYNFKVSGLLQEIADDSLPGNENSLFIIYTGYNDLNSIINPHQYNITTPFTENITSDNIMKDADKAKANELITSYNSLLKSKLNKLTGVEIKMADIRTWFEAAIANPEQFGLRTDNGPCVSGFDNPTECSDRDTHFFWDPYHPEAKVHKALGQWTTKLIAQLYPNKN